jgi:hypothetical protein
MLLAHLPPVSAASSLAICATVRVLLVAVIAGGSLFGRDPRSASRRFVQGASVYMLGGRRAAASAGSPWSAAAGGMTVRVKAHIRATT